RAGHAARRRYVADCRGSARSRRGGAPGTGRRFHRRHPPAAAARRWPARTRRRRPAAAFADHPRGAATVASAGVGRRRPGRAGGGGRGEPFRRHAGRRGDLAPVPGRLSAAGGVMSEASPLIAPRTLAILLLVGGLAFAGAMALLIFGES